MQATAAGTEPKEATMLYAEYFIDGLTVVRRSIEGSTEIVALLEKPPETKADQRTILNAVVTVIEAFVATEGNSTRLGSVQ